MRIPYICEIMMFKTVSDLHEAEVTEKQNKMAQY